MRSRTMAAPHPPNSSGHNRRPRRPRVLSVFSGAGGLDLGLEAAGFQTVGCIEFDPIARDTLRLNRPSWRMIEPSDINALVSSFSVKDIGMRRGQLDCIAAGVPCQPYSKAAQWLSSGHAGIKDPRSSCLRSLMRLVDECLPSVLVIENVEGFVRGKGAALRSIQSSLGWINARRATKYRAQWTVLDACDYGVPQHRRRSIIIARRDGSSFRWPEKTHTAQPVRAWDAIGSLHPKDPPRAQGHWAGLLRSIPEGGNYLHHTPRGKGEPVFGYRRRYWSFLLKLAKDRPSWTIPAQPAQNAGPFHWDNRRLSEKEMLRLQSFPTKWLIAGAEEDRVRQIGNATPPLLAEVIGRAVAEQVFGREYDRRPTLGLRRRRAIPAARRPAPVPKRYLRGRRDLEPHPGTGRGPGALRVIISEETLSFSGEHR